MRCKYHKKPVLEQSPTSECPRCFGSKAPEGKMCLTCSEALERCEVCNRSVPNPIGEQ